MNAEPEVIYLSDDSGSGDSDSTDIIVETSILPVPEGPSCSKNYTFSRIMGEKQIVPEAISNAKVNSIDEDFELPDDIEARFQYSSCLPPSTELEIHPSKSLTKENKNRKAAADIERKKIEKEQKKITKDLKIAEQQREKILKQSENELRRNSKPGEAYKFMIVVISESTVKKHEMLVPSLVAADIRCQTKTHALTNSFTFRREIVQRAMGNDLELHKISKFQDEDQLMILVEANEAVTMIHAYLSLNDAASEVVDEIDIITWVNSIQSQYPLMKITLLFLGIENYLKKVKKSSQQQFRDRVLHGKIQNSNTQTKSRGKKVQKVLPDVPWLDVHSCLIELQLRTNINYRIIKNVTDLSFLLIQYTKAVADAPFKKQRVTNSGFDWYAVADSSGSVRVDKDGTGCKALWLLQLQCFNNVGVEIARAITNKYPSPQALKHAYDLSLSVEEGHILLRDISVKVGIGPLAKHRTVGPELSKRMYRFFTSTDGDKFLSSTAGFN